MTNEAIADRRMRDDAALVDLARDGDEAAVRILVQRHNQKLFRVARGVVRNDAEAEDIVQETYVRAFTRLSGFRGEASLGTWLTRIALNEALGRLRRRKPSVELDVVETGRGGFGGGIIMFPSAPVPETPENEAGRRHMRELIEQAVDELPDIFRLVFILRDVEGCTTDETAALLSIRPETAKTRLHRARRLLREKLEERASATFAELFPFAGTRCAGMADTVVERLRQKRFRTRMGTP